MSRIVLGVSGGIAAYKACEVLRRLTENGHHVTVVPTPSALNFVGATTWTALSGQPVHTEVFADTHLVNHVRLGQEADLVLVAPATADLLARAASGRADDLLTNVLLTSRAPVLMFPAMHTEMWQHPATQANVATLRSRAVVVVDPASGRLTGADSGPGRLVEPAEIVDIAGVVLAEPGIASKLASRDMAGQRVVVSAGGTRESVDPVRFLGNASSGRMGVALARAAAQRGAAVQLVAAHLEVPAPSGVEVIPISSTADLARVMPDCASTADVVVMAVAAADFTVRQQAEAKIKKSGTDGLQLDLVQTEDVLKTLCAQRSGRFPLMVGFAAETPTDLDVVAMAQHKLARKGCDLIVANDVSSGVFGSDSNVITLVDATSAEGPLQGSKELLAHRIWDRVQRFKNGA